MSVNPRLLTGPADGRTPGVIVAVALGPALLGVGVAVTGGGAVVVVVFRVRK